MHAVAIGIGRFITACESLYHGPSRSARAVRSAARCQRAGASELMRGPSTASSAGSAISETVTATSAVAAPPMPIEIRNGSGMTHSEARRERDRDRAVGDRAPGRVDRAVQRLWFGAREVSGAVRRARQRAVALRTRLVASDLGELLAISRDDEQAVVDREAEAEADDDVERELRKRVEAVDDPQHEEGRDHREPADEQRHQRRDDAAEHEQRQDEQDRERETLGLAEVLADLLADLLAGHRAAAEHHVGRLLHAFEQALGGFVGRVVGLALEEGGDVGRVFVARHERTVAGVEEAERARHRRILAHVRVRPRRRVRACPAL